MSIAPPPAALTPPHPAPPRSDAYHEDGTLNLEHGTDDPTMCKLMDSVLAGHGFGMFVLGMLCGLACAFCAYLFITRCRSQGPKMGRARTMYSDSEVAGARGAQGDVPASELSARGLGEGDDHTLKRRGEGRPRERKVADPMRVTVQQHNDFAKGSRRARAECAPASRRRST